MTRLTLLAPVLALLVVAGCANKDTTESKVSPGMVNSMCPMSKKTLKAGCPTSTWDGVTVGFCGPGCKAAFDNQTPAEKDAEVANMKTQTTAKASPGMVNSMCPMSQKTLKTGCPTSTWDGTTIGFCGPGCKAAFDNQTPAEKDAEVAAMKQ